MTISMVALGSMLGAFILDLDYVIHAYFIEPNAHFSKTLAGYIKHKDFANAAQHIHFHKKELREQTLNSALFQMVLAGVTIFVVASSTNIFIQALVISTLANSLYRFSEYYFENDLEDWFWVLKNKPTSQQASIYGLCIFAVLIYSISIF